MPLQPIIPSSDPTLACKVTKTAHGNSTCAFCGVATGRWAEDGYPPPGSEARWSPCCVLCSLPQHLERPRVDEEATLVWLPEISQQAINVTMREMHVALQGLGEDVHADAVFRNRGSKGLAKFHHLRTVFTDRRQAAESRVGTMSPGELGLALLELSLAGYSRRGDLLGGLRLLPLGRFFVDDKDTYPEIVGFWRERAKTGPTISNGVR